jgi:hypothetical protein
VFIIVGLQGLKEPGGNSIPLSESPYHTLLNYLLAKNSPKVLNTNRDPLQRAGYIFADIHCQAQTRYRRRRSHTASRGIVAV